MAYFYCVGFPDLSRTWAQHGHVDNHEVYLCKQDAEEANKWLITWVHEFYVEDSMFASTIERLNIQRANFLANLALQESWPVVAERNHNSMILADQQGCRLILQECKA